MLQKYQDFRFRKSTLVVIDQANEIINEFLKIKHKITLRQLYYQFVARDLFPEDRKWLLVRGKWVRHEEGTKNAPPNYKWIGKIINNGRLAGLIDWAAIRDLTRSMKHNYHEINPAKAINYTAECYALDTRTNQDIHIEAWVEKEALIGIVEQVCREVDISWFACKGFVSQSAMYDAARRCRLHSQSKKILILHLGDHDPSGVDMTRDNFDRMEMFGIDLEVNRIALNMDQIEKYSPPPNPVKLTDSRSQPYIDKYGEESWELDALNPDVLSSLIRDEVAKHTDEDKRQARIEEEEEGKELLTEVSSRWEEVVDFLAE